MFQPGDLSDENKLVVRAWNMMGGSLDWVALPTVAGLLGIEDIDLLVHELIHLRDRTWQKSGNSS